MTLPSQQESEIFMRTLAIRNPDLLMPQPQYVGGKLTRAQNMGNAYEWIHEGWQQDDEPSPEQIAAALLMEARTQDDCVAAGESDASYPIRLRELARLIIHFHHEDI